MLYLKKCKQNDCPSLQNGWAKFKNFSKQHGRAVKFEFVAKTNVWMFP